LEIDMHVIQARNVNTALLSGLEYLVEYGRVEKSRNGRVLVAPDPVATVYLVPRERVLFSGIRDANPYFHYIESMWMLMGFQDVSTPARYARQMEYYTDDGVNLNGAYGWRWRRYFGYDQLTSIVNILKTDPSSRRCVLTMWSGVKDLLDQGSKDLPCNTHVNFRVVDGNLDILVNCRSNDIIWGAYGANVVHMSMLHEYMALRIGVGIGKYTQLSFNYHLYVDRPDVDRLINFDEGYIGYRVDDRYLSNDRAFKMPPLFDYNHPEDHSTFLEACSSKILNGAFYEQTYHRHATVDNVLTPMMRSHAAYRNGDYELAKDLAKDIDSEDWSTACVEWLARRERARREASDSSMWP